MDLAVYISELLLEQGTVTLPGLGIFKQVRVAGYYNDAEGKFYPPHFVAAFEAQSQANDLALALYISNRNKVSPGSARFFVNKYVADLLQQLDFQEVAIGQLGHLYKQDGEIRFRPDTSGAITSAAYGFSAINLRPEPQQPAQPAVPPVVTPAQSVQPAAPALQPAPKPVEELVSPQPEVQQVPSTQPVVNTPPVPQPAIPPVSTPAPTQPVTQPEHRQAPVTPEHITSQTNHRPEPARETEANISSWNVGRWVVIALIVVVAAVGGVAIYRNLQAENEQQKATEQADATIENTPNDVADTVVINKTPVVTDTPAVTQSATDSVSQQQPQAQALPPEAAAQPATNNGSAMPLLVNDKNYKFTLLGGAYDTREQATVIVNQYKAKGVNAAVLINPPSKRFKVTFGYFNSFAEGQQAKLDLVKTKQLPSAKLYVETIRQNPKK